MKKQEFKVLGHKVQYSVTESSTEFNKLDPARADAANDEAVNNIVYRSMNPETRSVFLHGRTQTEVEEAAKATPPQTLSVVKGVEAEVAELTSDLDPNAIAALGMKSGGNVVNTFERLVEVVKDKDGKPKMRDGQEITKYIEAEEQYYNRILAGLVAAKKFASEDVARAHFQPMIELVASEVPFDIVAAPRAERGPKKLAAKYKLAAAKVLTLGKVDSVNSQQLAKIGKSFTPTNDTSKMFTGELPPASEGASATPFSVSDKDAEALGWLVKEYFDWKAQQEMAEL